MGERIGGWMVMEDVIALMVVSIDVVFWIVMVVDAITRISFSDFSGRSPTP
jgi:hypothetical protein